jgi:hypothetical protein
MIWDQTIGTPRRTVCVDQDIAADVGATPSTPTTRINYGTPGQPACWPANGCIDPTNADAH